MATALRGPGYTRHRESSKALPRSGLYSLYCLEGLFPETQLPVVILGNREA
jgi:hypothetical protein